MRVVHYLNQFFGGIGGEEKATSPLEERSGAIGPGRLLEQVLGDDSGIVYTLVCGDDYAAEHLEEITAAVVAKVREADADLFVAGPCFEAGRYGLAAGALCAAVQAELGIPVTTAMAAENPGVDLYRQELYIIDSGRNVARMRVVLTKMMILVSKMIAMETIGCPSEEGYHPRGFIRDEYVEKTAAVRLVDMLLAKVRGEPFESELMVASFEPVPMPPPIPDMTKATVAIVTDGGLVPKGNPDKIAGISATNWGAYSIKGVDDLKGEGYEISHGGYDGRFVQEDPNRLVPVDVLREMEQDGTLGKLYDEFLSTSGLSNPLANSRRLGREMAQKLKEEGVDAVILTST